MVDLVGQAEGMRLAPVTCCISSVTPSAFGYRRQIDGSKPSATRALVLCESERRHVERPAMRTTPFFKMSLENVRPSLVGACAAWPPKASKAQGQRPTSKRFMLVSPFFIPCMDLNY